MTRRVNQIFYCLIFGCGFLFLTLTLHTQHQQSPYRGLWLVNVNTRASFDDAHIRGSIHIPYQQIRHHSKDWNRNDMVVVYCSDSACAETERVTQKFIDLGFTDCWVYRGGIQEWYQLSLEDEKKYPCEGIAASKILQQPIRKPATKSLVPEISASRLAHQIAHRLDTHHMQMAA